MKGARRVRLAVQITDDQGTTLTGVQAVNVGERVRVGFTVTTPGGVTGGPIWIVSGSHLREWIHKDALPIAMTTSDYQQNELNLVWRETSLPTTPHQIQVFVVTSAGMESATLEFEVVRDEKAEKFYSDDLLMEYHGNWHSVYAFDDATARRGDLFLAWHTSQLEYFNLWRQEFGYPALPVWDPTVAWATAPVPRSRQHPTTSPAPAPGFSERQGLITLELTASDLDHGTLGEYDLRTASDGRGTTSQFVTAGYVLRADTVTAVAGIPPLPEFNYGGVASLPSWYTVEGGTDADPWFAAGCPVDFDGGGGTTCSASTKTELGDYSLRELGESIESGWYRDDYRVNYHALGHVAASGDMGDPRTSMRDPIFWAWHGHIDQILRAWRTTQTAFEARMPELVLYTIPNFDGSWSTIRLAFMIRVVPELVKPSHVEVNGSPATSVTDVSFTGTGYIFDFTGFDVPADGTVEVVVRREVDTHVRTSNTDPRPAVGMLMSIYGQLFTPHVQRFFYTKP